MKRGGFTLIELLIVVAIIGILAAIAVPNFMNAQVRAKLSRVKADMQAMSTANEMYTVDNGRCTLGSLEGRNLGIWGDDNRVALNRLTSPIPYTSTVPDDPFAVTSHGLAPDLGAIRYTFTYNTTVNPEVRTNVHTMMFGAGFTWWMFSVGPGHTSGAPWPGPIMASHNPAYSSSGITTTSRIFDPSNGVNSEGWIIRTNKGVYP